MSYFEDAEKMSIRPALVNEEAEQCAKEIARMRSSQLRRFYDDVKALERTVLLGANNQEQAEIFERRRAMFVMLKANAAYGFKRSQAIVPLEFLQFVTDHVAAVKSKQEFQAFLLHFEAVIAFHRFYSEDK